MKPSTRSLLAQIATTAAALGAAALLGARSRRRRKVVVITGGSRGLGLALAERFGRSGCHLVLTARDADELTRAANLLRQRRAVASGADILLITADLTLETQARAAIGHTLARFGRIDVLINNAGIIQVGPAEDQPVEAYQRAMAANFFAALYTTHAALPTMLAQRKPAAIVNISSIGGKFPMPHLLPYVASKFALTGFSEGLHAELRHKGIRVTTVCPGLMRTGSHVQAEFTGDREKEYRWFALGATTPLLSASATHAANRIYKAVQSGSAEITITPQAWLAARLAGLAPATTQFIASLVNEYLLPTPAGSSSQTRGSDLPQPSIPFFQENSSQLQAANNQR